MAFSSDGQKLTKKLLTISLTNFSAECVRQNESSRYGHNIRPSVRPSVWDGRALWSHGAL